MTFTEFLAAVEPGLVRYLSDLLLENIPIPVFYKDNEGRYLGFNKAFEVFFGKSKQQLISKSVFDISPLEISKVYHAKDAELLEKPGVKEFVMEIASSLISRQYRSCRALPELLILK